MCSCVLYVAVCVCCDVYRDVCCDCAVYVMFKVLRVVCFSCVVCCE